MSWETLVIGRVKFREGSKEEDQYTFLSELQEELEGAKIAYEGFFHEWIFQDVNWASHITAEKIWSIVKKWRHILQLFEFSLYYLTTPHESIVLSREAKKVIVEMN